VSNLFSNLQFKKIILHNVHRPSATGVVPPTLSSEITNLASNGREKLQERISTVLGSGSSSLAMEVSDITPESCHEHAKVLIQANDTTFVTQSAAIAHLHTRIHTNKGWPAGTLVIISATTSTDNKRCLIIIKAEQQAGFTEKESKGKITMEYIENLILTPQSKLYKIGVFYEETAKPSGTVGKLKAHVFDSNIKAQDDRSAARYFYSNFLGLKIPENPEQRTRDFYEYTTEFITTLDVKPEKKLDLQQALHTYLKADNSHTIESTEFAEKYLAKDQRDDFSSYMEDKKFPDIAVIKDTKLINRSLARRKLNFSGSVKITAPAEGFSELVKIMETSDEHTTVQIKGLLLSQDI
jgi:hypothetical protein